MPNTTAAPAVSPQQLTAGPVIVPPLADGEHWAGIVSLGTQLHHVILLPGEFRGAWKDAMTWAKEQGGELPSLLEQKLLSTNLRDKFKPEWHWSCEQHASDESFAWMQDFISGFQYYGHKASNTRARAVRRLPIQ